MYEVMYNKDIKNKEKNMTYNLTTPETERSVYSVL